MQADLFFLYCKTGDQLIESTGNNIVCLTVPPSFAQLSVCSGSKAHDAAGFNKLVGAAQRKVFSSKRLRMSTEIYRSILIHLKCLRANHKGKFFVVTIILFHAVFRMRQCLFRPHNSPFNNSLASLTYCSTPDIQIPRQ